ncbi:hypothetical protein AB0F72_09080 [Actinoplanes sp. NPDC023936]|uniref:hypothetical protein n=1 Tax=Actinoplanes sp. NPDC023936 TaxID=3154910 RepID=UPI0033D98B29
MAITASGLYVDTFVRQLRQQAWTGTGGLDHTLATWKVALYSDSLTPNFSATSPSYSATNEVTGTNWPAGGVLLSAAAAGGTSVVPTLAEGTTGSVRYDWTNDLVVAGVTLTGAMAMQLYADPITAPYADPLIALFDFITAVSPNNGNLSVVPQATGLYELDVTPA